MDPGTLASTLRGAIEAQYDMDMLNTVIAEEAEEREALGAEVRKHLEG